MAIQPKELDQLSDDESVIVGDLETLIDRYLRLNYIPGQEVVTVSAGELKDLGRLAELTPRTREELHRRYKEAGWKEMAAMPDKVILSRETGR